MKKISLIFIFIIAISIISYNCSSSDEVSPSNTSSSTSTTSTTSTIDCKSKKPSDVRASENLYLTKIDIMWVSVDNTEYYNIYRSKNIDSDYEIIATSTTIKYTDDSVKAGEKYYYKVTAVITECGESDFSIQDLGSTKESPTDMVYIPKGSFTMGDEWGDGGDKEKPAHSVTINPFYMDTTEVTTKAFEEYIVSESPDTTTYYLNSSKASSNIYLNNTEKDNHPVNCVSWFGADNYCKWKDKRLPTEAEWEYAAGNGTKHYKWSLDETEFTETNYCYNKTETCPIKSYPANEFGLYDMSGNVYEWCFDYYDKDSYSKCSDPCIDPVYITNTTNRIIRGSSWSSSSKSSLRTAYRFYAYPNYRDDYVGFRCVQD